MIKVQVFHRLEKPTQIDQKNLKEVNEVSTLYGDNTESVSLNSAELSEQALVFFWHFLGQCKQE